MKLGKRDGSVLLQRLTEGHSYAAALRMLLLYTRPLDIFYRELFSKGGYPTTVVIRTPIGPRTVHLYHYEDLSTLNSIFCRHDYAAPRPLETVVDFGANIGLSCLYWLTRNPRSRVYLYEPVPANFEHLKLNLSGLESRYEPEQVAVSDSRGTVEFGIEPTGRLGSIGAQTGRTIQVRRVHVMDAIGPVLERHGAIDCLKVDIEGHERAVLGGIEPKCFEKIRYINVEDIAGKTRPLVPPYFTCKRHMSIQRYANTRLNGR